MLTDDTKVCSRLFSDTRVTYLVMSSDDIYSISIVDETATNSILTFT